MAYRTRLDEDGCIDLLSILQVVNQIDQEQAWAICYEICILMKELTNRQQENNINSSRCAPIESLGQVHIHKDGYVHEKTCLLTSSSSSWLHQQQQKQQQKQLNKKKQQHSTTNRYKNNSSHNDDNQDDEEEEDDNVVDDDVVVHDDDDDDDDDEQEVDQDLDEDEEVEERAMKLEENNESGNPSPTRTSNSSSPTLSSTNESSSLSPTSDVDLNIRSCSSPELSEILKRRPAVNEFELVASMSIALFWALDYGIPNDEERKLSISMEYLIFQSQTGKLSFDDVLELCEKRLPPATKTKANSHYGNVCKSLVQDTIQLSIFLEKIYTASMVLSDISEHELSELGEPLASLRALKIDDWARLWMHVIKELKQALAIT